MINNIGIEEYRSEEQKMKQNNKYLKQKSIEICWKRHTRKEKEEMLIKDKNQLNQNQTIFL